MAPGTEENAPGKNAKQPGSGKTGRGFIDTAAPFESVKAAVSMFGGIVDWKAHKVQSIEKNKQVQVVLEKANDEIANYRSQSEAAEDEKAHVVKELEDTRRLIEELKLSLEKAETEAAESKQDSELALLRVKELQQGVADEESTAAQAELDLAKTRHASAVAELKSVRDELEATRKEFALLSEERDIALKNASEAVSKSKDIEKNLDDLTLDLITAKDTLESAHAEHMEAEEHRINVALAKAKDAVDWEKELKQAEEELQQLNDKMLAMKDLQAKVDTASSILLNLKNEFTAYMESKSNKSGSTLTDDDKDPASHPLSETEKELEEVKMNIEKANEDVKCLRIAAASLKAELAGEEAVVASLKEKEGVIPAQVLALESELSRIEMEIELLQAKEKETQRQLEDLPQSVEQTTKEAEEARSAANLANEDLLKAKEEAEQAKASANAAESRLRAALREIEAAKASERLAFEAIKALEDSEKATSTDLDNSQSTITLPLEEYYMLSKKAHDAEEQAVNQVADAMSQLEEFKKSEARSSEKLAEATRRLEERKEAMRLAVEKADSATEGKLAVEQELREWRAVNEQRRKSGEDSKDVFNPSRRSRMSLDDSKGELTEAEAASPIRRTHSAKANASDGKAEGRVAEPKKKKKSFFPRVVMFLARKKAHSAK